MPEILLNVKKAFFDQVYLGLPNIRDKSRTETIKKIDERLPIT